MDTTDANITQDSSTGDNDVTEISSTPENDVNASDSSTDEDVPFHKHSRFQELVQEKNDWKDKYQDLETRLEDLETQKEPKAEETYPDIFEDQKAYAKYVEAQTIAKIEAKQEAKAQREKDANKVVEGQFAEIKELAGADVDEEAIGQFAIDNNIRLEDKSYDLKTAYNLMQKLANIKEDRDVAPNKEIKVAGSGSTSAPQTALPTAKQVKIFH